MKTSEWFPNRAELCVLLLVFVIPFYQLIIPPVLGLADNGDFRKIALRSGLTTFPEEYSDRYWNYVNIKWQRTTRWVPSDAVLSSESLFVEMSLRVNKILSKDGTFDIRSLGLTHLAFLVIVFWLILLASRMMRPLMRWLMVGAFLIIFLDAAYILYFNSFYTETASLLFLGLTVGLALLLIALQDPRGWHLCLWFAASVGLICAKPQNSPLGFFLMVFCLGLLRMKATRSWKVMVVGLSVSLVAISIGYYLNTPRSLRDYSLYNDVFYGILRFTPDPVKDLDDLGLSRDLIRYANRYPFQPGDPIKNPEFRKAFYERIGHGTVVKFYITHPRRLLNLLQWSTPFAFKMRLDYLGNFDKSVGLPARSQSRAFTRWSTLKERLLSGSIAFLVCFFGLNLAGVVILHRRSIGLLAKMRTELFVGVLLMALTQFGVAVFGDAEIELSRHLFLFNVLVDICLVVDVLWCVNAAKNFFTAVNRPSSIKALRWSLFASLFKGRSLWLTA